jgi:hypothetical protein
MVKRIEEVKEPFANCKYLKMKKEEKKDKEVKTLFSYLGEKPLRNRFHESKKNEKAKKPFTKRKYGKFDEKLFSYLGEKNKKIKEPFPDRSQFFKGVVPGTSKNLKKKKSLLDIQPLKKIGILQEPSTAKDILLGTKALVQVKKERVRNIHRNSLYAKFYWTTKPFMDRPDMLSYRKMFPRGPLFYGRIYVTWKHNNTFITLDRRR